MAIKYDSLAASLLRDLGGESNVKSVVSCSTRLRFQLVDREKVNKAAIEKSPGVLAVVESGGQFQVVIGNDVPVVYAEIGKISKLTSGGGSPTAEATGTKGGLFSRAIDVISSIFTPILWVLAGTGLLKAFLSLFAQLGWLDRASDTYTILSAAADATFYFLPLFLAVTAARRFNASQFVAMAIAGALVYPSIIALNAPDAGQVTFLGIPVEMVAYTSSVLPIIFTVWVLGHLERALRKVLPTVIRNFTVPMLSVAVLVPFTLIVVGPVLTWLSSSFAHLLTSAFSVSPVLAGAILGGTGQLLVIFGVHWGMVALIINDLSTQGFTLITGPILPAVLAMAAATAGVLVKTRNKELKELAGSSAVSGFLAGVTEPAIYGVTLPLKKPFIYALIGGAVGGAIAASGGVAQTAFAPPGLVALPTYMNHGSFPMLLLGSAVAIAIGFILTVVLGFKDVPAKAVIDEATDRLAGDDVADAEQAFVPGGGVATLTRTAVLEVSAPVAGTIVNLADVKDPLFSTSALGKGAAITPASGRIVAPIDGVLVTVMPHAFGIAGENGVEVLVHVGIDTVNLAGNGFTGRAARGDRVARGDVISEVDFASIVKAGYDPTTMVIVTNTAAYEDVKPVTPGPIGAGEPLLTVIA
jgi:beta-glucoside PTS system EIICBA component